VEVRPSARGFLRFYIESASPLAVYGVYVAASRYLPPASAVLALSVPLVALAVAWVLRSRFAAMSIGLFTAYVVAAAACELRSAGVAFGDAVDLAMALEQLSEVLPRRAAEGAVLSTAAALAYAEAFRRSIRYRVGRGGVTISGGVLRRQEVFYPYTQISNVVVERGPLARLLGYGYSCQPAGGARSRTLAA